MKCKFVVVLMVFGYLAIGQTKPLPAKLDSNTQAKFIRHIRDSLCSSLPFGMEHNSISYETTILRFYPFVRIKKELYSYDKNIYDYLLFDDSYLSFAFDTSGGFNSFIGIIFPNVDSTCFSVEESVIGVSDKYFNILQPMLSKIDFENASVFMMPHVTKTPLIYVLIDTRVFVISNQELVPFNKYFRSKYNIKNLQNMLEGVEIK